MNSCHDVNHKGPVIVHFPKNGIISALEMHLQGLPPFFAFQQQSLQERSSSTP
jgi:hypothetical protein